MQLDVQSVHAASLKQIWVSLVHIMAECNEMMDHRPKSKIFSEVIWVPYSYSLQKEKANFLHNMMMQLYVLSVHDASVKLIRGCLLSGWMQ